MMAAMRRGMDSILPVLTVAAFAAATAMPGGHLEAHHGYSLNYETDEIGTIEGIVREVFWSNPHVQYYVSVANDDESNRTWIVETHNLRILKDEGWTRDTVEAGDKVRVRGYLGRGDRPRIAGMEFELEDGSVHSLFGEASDDDESSADDSSN